MSYSWQYARRRKYDLCGITDPHRYRFEELGGVFHPVGLNVLAVERWLYNNYPKAALRFTEILNSRSSEHRDGLSTGKQMSKQLIQAFGWRISTEIGIEKTWREIYTELTRQGL